LGATTLPGYLEDLIIWGQQPLNLTKLELYYWPQVSTALTISGKGEYVQQEIGTFGWWLEATSNEGKAHLLISVTKLVYARLHPPAVLVPERFPPLKDRLHGLRREALFDELGKGYDPRRILTYPSARDKIVLSELLSRGPVADAEVHRIFMGDFKGEILDWRVIHSRVHSFLDAAEARMEIPSYAPALERLCMGAREREGLSEMTLHGLVGKLHLNGVDFSRAALSIVERNQFPRVGFAYLDRYAASEEVFQKLAAMAVPPERQKDKEHALKRMRERIEKARPK
jgi:hypothetical protein